MKPATVYNAALIFGFQPIKEPEIYVFVSITHEAKWNKTAKDTYKKTMEVWSSSSSLFFKYNIEIAWFLYDVTNKYFPGSSF